MTQGGEVPLYDADAGANTRHPTLGGGNRGRLAESRTKRYSIPMMMLNAEALADFLADPAMVERARRCMEALQPDITSVEAFVDAANARFAAAQPGLDEGSAAALRTQLAQVNETLANAQEKLRLLEPQGGLQAEYHVWSRTQSTDDVLRANSEGLTLALRDDLRFILEALTLVCERLDA